MKNKIILLTMFFLASVNVVAQQKKLPNGKYFVELDKKYIENGLNNYEFVLQDSLFIYKLEEKIENLEINWIDENSFVVKGLTEPLNSNEIEKNILKRSTIAFRIIKQENNKYYFTLGEEFDKYPIYSGKFVKKN